jgi:hypothetical protein
MGGWVWLRAIATGTVGPVGDSTFAGRMAGSHDPMAIAITERAHRVRRGIGGFGQGSHIDVGVVCRYAAFFASPKGPDRSAGLAPDLLDGRAYRNDGGTAVTDTIRGAEPGSDT